VLQMLEKQKSAVSRFGNKRTSRSPTPNFVLTKFVLTNFVLTKIVLTKFVLTKFVL
jgi:hypothetical protein